MGGLTLGPPKTHNLYKEVFFLDTLAFIMDILAYISVFIIVLGWLGLLIVGLSDDLFKNDGQDKLHLKSLPKANPDKPSKTSKPE